MSSFCICKSYSHFFSKNTCELDIVFTRTVNILTTNELVKLTVLWITGPWLIVTPSVIQLGMWFFPCMGWNTALTFYDPLLYFKVKWLGQKPSDGRVVSARDFWSQGLKFEFQWRWNLAHGCTAFHCTEPFIINLPSACDDLNNVERDVKHQTIIIIKWRSIFCFNLSI